MVRNATGAAGAVLDADPEEAIALSAAEDPEFTGIAHHGFTTDTGVATTKLTVLVGSDDPFSRSAFRTGASGPGIDVLAAGTLTEVVDQWVVELEPDIALLDVQTTAAAALRAIQHVRVSAPTTRILACAAPAGTDFGLLCLAAGAWGYVSKEIEMAVLPRVIRALANGEAVIPQALGTELVKRFIRPTPADRARLSADLSHPECRLLNLLGTGQTLTGAAAELGISVATAKRHFGSARQKLSVPPPA